MRTTFDEERTCIQLDNHKYHQRQHQHKRLAPKEPGQVAAQEEHARQVAARIVVEPCLQEWPQVPPSCLRLGQVEAEGAREGLQFRASEPQTGAKTTLTRSATVGGPGQQAMDNSQATTERVQRQHLAQHQQQKLGQLQATASATNPQATRYLIGGHQCHQQPATSQPPRSYPNNTLVEDLSRCHDNLWPKAARATSRTLKLIKACAPTDGKTANEAKQIESSEPVDLRTASCDEMLAAAAAVPRGRLETLAESKRLKFVRAKRKKYKFPIPDSISRLNSTLNQDDYNRALCVLTNDIRFQLHILFFGRLQTIWTLSSTILCILIPILFAATTPETYVILGACAGWLGLQAAGALVTSQCRRKLDQMLERSVAQANSYFLDHKLMLGVINRGGLLAKSRLVIPMVYFDTFECMEQIESIVSVDSRESSVGIISDKDSRSQLARRAHPTEFGPPNGPGAANQKAFAQSQLAKKIVLRYSQRWISHFDKRRLMFTDDKLKPRHLSTGKCLCQFIEEHLGRDKRIEDFGELERVNRAGQSAQVATEATIEQLRVDKLECAPRRQESNESNEIARQQATVINIPTNNKNNSSQLDEQSLNETLTRSRALASLTCPRIATSYGPHAELFVPTLSQLVSMKDAQHQHQQTRTNTTTESSPDSSPGSNYSSKLIDGFASHLQQERIDSNSSPMTELSLELEGESLLNRNDELIKRLKTLLEIRANEFSKGLDQAGANSSLGQINRNYYQESGNSPRPVWARDRAPVSGGSGLSSGSSLSGQTIHQDDASNTSNTHASPISHLGKKFFSQTDGLFFLGTRKGHQPGVYAKQQQQLLEIC